MLSSLCPFVYHILIFTEIIWARPKLYVTKILSQLGLFFYLTENRTTKSWDQIDYSLAYKVGLPPLKYKMKRN